MTGRDIVLQALRNETTPRPGWVPFVGVHGGNLIGASAKEYLQSSDLLVQGLSRARKLYEPDGLPLIFDLQLEAEVLGCAMHWADEAPPAVISHPLTNAAPEDLPTFDLGKGRYPLAAEALRTLKTQWADEVALYGLITGPFTLALHLIGTDIFLKMYDQADEVRKVIDLCTRIGTQAAQFYLDHGADVIAIVDPMTSQISPEHFEAFVTSGVNEIFTQIRERNGLSSFFVCGNATRNLELMCRTQCDNVSVDENISLESLRDLASQHDKSFGGNLKLTTVLLLGSEDDAKRDALRCLDVGGNKGFVLAPGCDLPYGTPERNLQAVSAIARDDYQRDVARATASSAEQIAVHEFDLPDYESEDKVIVDVVTLDSASCAPCQYMVDAVEQAAAKMGGKVVINEHKITTHKGLGAMAKLGVGQIPTICIDGEVKFPSIIPDINTLIAALEGKAREKQG